MSRRALSEIIKSFHPAFGGILFGAIFYFLNYKTLDKMEGGSDKMAY